MTAIADATFAARLASHSWMRHFTTRLVNEGRYAAVAFRCSVWFNLSKTHVDGVLDCQRDIS